jgi:hypothetical protein
MSDDRNENVETSQVSPTKPVSPQEKILLAPGLEPTTREEVEASKRSLTYGTTIDARDIRPETGQSSSENALDELPSGERQARSRYRILFHILAWLVMTGSVPFLF